MSTYNPLYVCTLNKTVAVRQPDKCNALENNTAAYCHTRCHSWPWIYVIHLISHKPTALSHNIPQQINVPVYQNVLRILQI